MTILTITATVTFLKKCPAHSRFLELKNGKSKEKSCEICPNSLLAIISKIYFYTEKLVKRYCEFYSNLNKMNFLLIRPRAHHTCTERILIF